MDYRTFNEWSSAGYKIKKGSKAKWIDDVPMFSEKQVTKYTKPSRTWGYSYSAEYPDWDDPFEDMARAAAWGN